MKSPQDFPSACPIRKARRQASGRRTTGQKHKARLKTRPGKSPSDDFSDWRGELL